MAKTKITEAQLKRKEDAACKVVFREGRAFLRFLEERGPRFRAALEGFEAAREQRMQAAERGRRS